MLEFERIYSKPSEKITYESIAQRLRNTWPTRCESLTTSQLRAFIGSAGEVAQQDLHLGDPDLEAYVTLALYFGYKFAADPFHAWAGKAFALNNLEEKRHASGAGVIAHFKAREYVFAEEQI